MYYWKNACTIVEGYGHIAIYWSLPILMHENMNYQEYLKYEETLQS